MRAPSKFNHEFSIPRSDCSALDPTARKHWQVAAHLGVMKISKANNFELHGITRARATGHPPSALKTQLDKAVLLLSAGAGAFMATPAHSKPIVGLHSSRVEVKVSVRPHYRLEVRDTSKSASLKDSGLLKGFCLATNMRAFAIPVTVAKLIDGEMTEKTQIDVGLCGRINNDAASNPVSLADAQQPHLLLVIPE